MSGYFRFPSIHKNNIVFVSENNLWLVALDNLKAIRLTANLSSVTTPLFSPDGKWIAYVGIEDGNTEVYIIPGEGGTEDDAYVISVIRQCSTPRPCVGGLKIE